MTLSARWLSIFPLAWLVAGGCAQDPPSGSPEPPAEAAETSQAASCNFENSTLCQSSVITGISWNCNGGQLGAGSDIWPTTWAADDSVIVGWGDGSGFGGDNTSTKVSTGFGQLTGMPPLFTGTINLWGGNSPRAPARFGGKPGSLISAQGQLFTTMGIWTGDKDLGVGHFGDANNGFGRLVWSTSADHDDWQFETDWFYQDSSAPGPFACCGWINFGKDNAGAPGFPTFLYAYASTVVPKGMTATTILTRVPVASVRTKSSYEFFRGVDGSGNPLWGPLAQAVSVFNVPGTESLVANFDAGLNRYLISTVHGNGTTLEQAIFDAPNMWGPWTTVQFTDHWCSGHFGTGEDEGIRFTSKWMLNGGATLWAAYSAAAPADALGLVTATLYQDGPAPRNSVGVSALSGLGPDDGDGGHMSGLQITAPNKAVSVTALSVFLATAIDPVNNQFQVAIYTDSAGKPSARVASSPSFTAVEGWNSVPLTAALNANTKYWLLYNTNTSATSGLNELSNAAIAGASNFFFTAQTFGTWPATISGGTTFAGKSAMYVSYNDTTSGTLGNNWTAGLARDDGDNNHASGSLITVGSQAVHASSLSVFLDAAIDAAPNDKFQVAIYTDAGGHPGSPVVTSATQSARPGWNTVTLSANLTANTRYWLVYNTNATKSGFNELYNAGKSGFSSFFTTQPVAFGTWPTTMPAGTTWAGASAMYINFP